MLRLRGADGGRAARRGPRDGVRAAGRGSRADVRRATTRTPTWLSAGMSGDLEAAVAAGRDTRACRLARSSVRGPRSSSVTTTQQQAAQHGGAGAPEEGVHERRDAQDRRVPRPARGHRPLRRRLRRAGYDDAATPQPSHAACRAQREARPPRSPTSPSAVAPARAGPRAAVVAELSRITTLHPRTYNEARTIGENFREGMPVIMNLSEMDDTDAKRLVDFAAGLVFATRGTIERVTNKVFLLSPPNVSVAAEDKQRIAEGGFFNQS